MSDSDNQRQLSPDEYLAAFRKDLSNAPLALYAGASLFEAGRHNEAVAVWNLGDDANSALRAVRHYPEIKPEMRAHSELADKSICEFFTNLHRSTVLQYAEEHSVSLERITNAIWVHYNREQTRYLHDDQKPLIFYLPDLPAKPFYHSDEFDWAAQLQAASKDILEEFTSAKQRAAKLIPYVDASMTGDEWKTLRGDPAWSSLYLYLNAQKTEHTDLFPKTCEALNKIHLVRKNDLPMEVFISVLKPGAHIPPHFGLTNSRLTVHLPLVIPDECAIRVGNEVHEWQEGELIAFDDTFEHEAWNKSDKERYVLIFEIPHPSLTTDESASIEKVYEAFDGWVASRRQIIGLV